MRRQPSVLGEARTLRTAVPKADAPRQCTVRVISPTVQPWQQKMSGTTGGRTMWRRSLAAPREGRPNLHRTTGWATWTAGAGDDVDVEACRVDGRRATGDAIPIRDQAKLKRIQQQQTCVELLGAQSRNPPAAHFSPSHGQEDHDTEREREGRGEDAASHQHQAAQGERRGEGVCPPCTSTHIGGRPVRPTGKAEKGPSAWALYPQRRAPSARAEAGTGRRRGAVRLAPDSQRRAPSASTGGAGTTEKGTRSRSSAKGCHDVRWRGVKGRWSWSRHHQGTVHGRIWRCKALVVPTPGRRGRHSPSEFFI